MIFDAVSMHCLLFGDRRGRNTIRQFQVHSYTCFKFMVHSLAEGGRWCPGLAIDVRLLDRGSFNIGIASFHVTTCFILNLPSLNISY